MANPTRIFVINPDGTKAWIPLPSGASTETIAAAVSAYLIAHPPSVDISGKVDKVTGKSLVSDTEITKIHALHADDQTIPTTLAALTDDETHRLVTDTEKGAWNGKGTSNLALGDLVANAYYGDKGKTSYDHSQTTHAPSNAQKNSDITKAEIEAKLTGGITTHSHSLPETVVTNCYPAAGSVIAAGYCVMASMEYEIASTTELELSLNSILEVI
jgi:hypothetical protein